MTTIACENSRRSSLLAHVAFRTPLGPGAKKDGWLWGSPSVLLHQLFGVFLTGPWLFQPATVSVELAFLPAQPPGHSASEPEI